MITTLPFQRAVDGIGDLLSSCVVDAFWSFISPQSHFIFATLLSCSAMIMLLAKK